MPFQCDRIDQAIRVAEGFLRQAYLDNSGADDWDTVRKYLNEARIEIERIVDVNDRNHREPYDPDEESG